MPEGPPLYPPEQISSQSLDFTVAETVREKLIRALSQELPYALTVETEALERSGALVKAQVVIWVERDGQKKIVVGEGGEMLKRVGSAARRELEKTLGGRFHLEIWVRVKENWSDDPRSLRRFGYQDG
jgi:GTPase